MATEIIMPKAGMAMETGQVIEWLKSEGDYVEAGEPLLEIETDKVSMEVEAEASGYLLKILRGPGETVPVIETIGYLGQKGEESPASSPEMNSDSTVSDRSSEPQRSETKDTVRQEHDAGSPEAAEVKAPDSGTSRAEEGEIAQEKYRGKIAATPAARRRASELAVDLSQAKPSGIYGEVRVRDVQALSETTTTTADMQEASARSASPLARRIAESEDMDLSELQGSGPGGRVLRKDIIAALAAMQQAEPGESGSERREAMSGMRRTISRRMLQSHLTMPPVTLDARIDVTNLFALRKQLNSTSEYTYSVNDFLLKAAAKAVRSHEQIRTAIDGDEVVIRESVNLGMAVSVDTGLLVPVIQHADNMSLGSLAGAARDLSTRARDGKLGPDELKGGTFTVTNLGMYGIHSFTPIINPPQSAILGVNAAEPLLRKDEQGNIEERRYMMLSLTIDHRVIDGAQGARFLATLRELIENPMQILV